MKNSKLIPILSTFSGQDWKEFSKWSRSYYELGSNSENVIALLSGLKDIHRIKSNAAIIDIIKERPGIELSKGSLANLLTSITEMLEEFLIAKQLNTNTSLKEALLLDSFAHRGLVQLFNAAKTKKKTQEEKSIWTNYFDIKEMYNAYFKGFYQNYEDSRAGLEQLSDSVLHFKKDISDFIELEMINRSIVLGADWDKNIVELQRAEDVRTPFSRIFENVVAMRRHNDEKAYNYLKQLVLEHKEIAEEAIEVLMVHITSYLNLRFKSGEYKLADDVLAFYNIGVKNGYYLTDGKMSPRRFLNIVNTACSLDKQRWATTFTESYKHLLEQKFKNDVVLLCEAAIAFADKDFATVSDILLSNRFSDFDLEYRARLLKLQNNMEMEKEDPTYILDEIRTFKYYIKRNESKLNLATIRGTKTLLKYIERIIEGKLEQIREDLGNEKYIMMGRWLHKTIDAKLRHK